MTRAGLAALVAIVCFPVSLYGQEPQAVLEADVTEVTVGDRISARITIEHSADETVEWATEVDLSPFEILEFAPTAARIAGDRAVSEALLTLTVFELGEVEIPSLSFSVTDPTGAARSVTTDPFVIGVGSVGLDEGGDIRDVKGPRDIALALTSLLPWVLALLLAGLLVAWALRRRGAPTPRARPSAPVRPPHEIACAALDRLESVPLLESAQVKAFHIDVSQVLRAYIEARFGIDALEMTTGELVAALRQDGFGGPLLDDTRRFLDACDLVKFAKRRPGADESRALIPLARRFVDETRPVEPVPIEPDDREPEAA